MSLQNKKAPGPVSALYLHVVSPTRTLLIPVLIPIYYPTEIHFRNYELPVDLRVISKPFTFFC